MRQANKRTRFSSANRRTRAFAGAALALLVLGALATTYGAHADPASEPATTVGQRPRTVAGAGQTASRIDETRLELLREFAERMTQERNERLATAPLYRWIAPPAPAALREVPK